MLQILQTFATFQKIQSDNVVDFENAAKRVFTCKDRHRNSRKRAKFCQKFASKIRVHYPTGELALLAGSLAGRTGRNCVFDYSTLGEGKL